MEDRLADLSHSLNDAFADTISRIQRLPESRSRLGMDALKWLTHTTEAMREEELSDALAVHKKQSAVNVKYRPTTKTILECCQGLATVDADGCVRLAHYAIQEYLAENSEDLFPRAEATLAVTCLRYLVFETFRDGPWTTETEIESKMATYPFLDWAARYWGQFTRRTETDAEVWSALLNFFSSPVAPAVANQVRQLSMGLIEGYWRASECKSFTALHHASREGLERAVDWLLERDTFSVNERTRMGATPVIMAAADGHLQTTRNLLAYGADPLLENWYGNALQCAIEANCVATVRELVRWGMDPNAPGKDGRGYLKYALDTDSAGAFAALVELGADIESQCKGDPHGHLFFTATSWGCTEVVALMLDRGWAEIEMRNPGGLTALHCAVAASKMTTTRRLLDSGANVDAMDLKRRTALEYAQAKGNKTMARLLLAAGATPRGENRLSGRATRATRWI